MAEKTDHDLIIEIHSVLLGTNGQGGLCRSHEVLKKDYYNFKRLVIGIFCFLVGSGVISLGVIEIAKAIGK